MAKRKRDYKAEYARRKALARERGYRSPREVTRARRLLRLPRGRTTLPRASLPPEVLSDLSGARMASLRVDAAEWSREHSHQAATRYSGRMGREQAAAFHAAFVEKAGNGKAIRARIFRYLKKYFPDSVKGTEQEWISEKAAA